MHRMSSDDSNWSIHWYSQNKHGARRDDPLLGATLLCSVAGTDLHKCDLGLSLILRLETSGARDPSVKTDLASNVFVWSSAPRPIANFGSPSTQANRKAAGSSSLMQSATS